MLPNSNIGRGLAINYGVVLVPRLLHVITALFESEGIYEHVTFGQYAYEMIPLEGRDIVSFDYLPNWATDF